MTAVAAEYSARPGAIPLSRIKYALFFLAVILVPFGNTALGDGPLGVFGKTPSSFPLLLLSAILLRESFWKFSRSNFVKLLAIIYMLTNVYFIIYYNFSFLERSLFEKSINSFLLYFAVLVPAVWYRLPPRHILMPVLIAGAVLILGYLGSDVLRLPGLVDNALWHATANAQQRPRGFATEASIFGSQLIIVGGILAMLLPGRFLRLAALVAFCGIAASISSKGAIATMALAAMGAVIFRIVRRPWTALVLALAGTALVFLLPQTQDLIWEVSQSNQGSFGTRGAVVFAAIWFVVQHPFGAGFGSLAPALIEVLNVSIDTFRDSFGMALDYDEINRSFLQATNDRFITAKSGLMDFAIICGIPSVILVFYLFLNPIFGRKRIGLTETFTLLSGLISVAAYTPIVGMYHFTILLVVVGSLEHQTSKRRASAARPNADSFVATDDPPSGSQRA